MCTCVFRIIYDNTHANILNDSTVYKGTSVILKLVD